MESALVRMSAVGLKAFMRALEADLAPVPQMVAVLKRPAPWGTGGLRK